MLTDRERWLRTMRYESVDHRPLGLVGPWIDTLERWYGEGLPRGVDVHEFLGVQGSRMINISGIAGLYPFYETRTISEDKTFRISLDSYGRTVRTFIDHTSMPEWLDFPVKSPADLQQVLDEHFDIDNLDARFGPEWEAKIQQDAQTGAVIMIDGGCYYWTLRSLAGVEYASYLFYDAPELIDELFERYYTVVMEGIRRAAKLVRIDCIGFGEDIAYKTGTLISPAMFRQYILPRYAKTMELAHSIGVEFTAYDSDGDVREFIPDYLNVGINGLAPCEVAANMIPSELRKQFGRDLRMIGGIDKREVARGKAAIDAEIERNKSLIDEGGYIPSIDHSVSSDISFDNYRYYLDAIQKALGM
ncbi:MAG TPA: uroporphyrinogen decarboxylase family protein [Armatimonadota bacterium]